MSDRNKIAQSLTVEQLDEFIRELAALPGTERTYAGIQKHAAARGITVSIEGAKSFREKTFKNYLARMERRREFAQRVASVRQESTGATLADAAAENLAEQIFDLTEELGEGESLDLKKASSVAFIISKIRQGDVAKGNLEAKLREIEERNREREEARAEKKKQLQLSLTKAEKKGGISKETLALIETELGLL